MIPFTLNPEVKLGDLLTSLSLLVATGALVTTWLRDRNVRRREYADRIRDSAAHTIVALRRRRTLANRLFDAIEPRVTEADRKLVATYDVIAVRDEFWQRLVEVRAGLLRELFEERLEQAYVALLGYDASVQEVFLSALTALDDSDQRVYESLLQATQDDILAFLRPEEQPQTAELGNALRHTLGILFEETAAQTEAIVAVAEQQLLKLVNASDTELFRRKVKLVAQPLKRATKLGR